MGHLAIGDTGAQLITKFNNLYDKHGYFIDDYCTGDGVTDNTISFNSLLTVIGNNPATIIITGGRFLIGSCTIKINIALRFAEGSRIIWKKKRIYNMLCAN